VKAYSNYILLLRDRVVDHRHRIRWRV